MDKKYIELTLRYKNKKSEYKRYVEFYHVNHRNLDASLDEDNQQEVSFENVNLYDSQPKLKKKAKKIEHMDLYGDGENYNDQSDQENNAKILNCAKGK